MRKLSDGKSFPERKLDTVGLDIRWTLCKVDEESQCERKEKYVKLLKFVRSLTMQSKNGTKFRESKLECLCNELK